MRIDTRILPAVMQRPIAHIENMILSGALPPGSKLPSERELSEQLNVSRPVVREILKFLQAQRLIDILPGKGSFITDLPATGGEVTIDHLVRRGAITTRQVVVARRMIESEAAFLAAHNRTPEAVRELRKILDEFEKAERVQRAIDLDLSFHEKVVVSSGNPVIQIMFGSIRHLVRAMIARSLSDQGVRSLGAPIHYEILDAIERQDADRARAAVQSHLSVSEQTYGEDMDRPLADVLMQRAELGPEYQNLLSTDS